MVAQSPSNMPLYLRDRSAQMIVSAATLRWKTQHFEKNEERGGGGSEHEVRPFYKEYVTEELKQETTIKNPTKVVFDRNSLDIKTDIQRHRDRER